MYGGGGGLGKGPEMPVPRFWTIFAPFPALFGSWVPVFRALTRGVGRMPSNLPGDLAVFGPFGVKNDPKKKSPNVFGDTLGGVFMMFPDGFDAFWATQTPIRVSDHLA